MAESKILQKKNEIDIYQRVLSDRALLRKTYGTDFRWPSPDDIKKIIVILGSSRSGSSLLYHLLSRHPDLLSLQGEEVTFGRIFGLNEIKTFDDSDICPSLDDVDLPGLAQEILYDSGFSGKNKSRLPLDRAQRILLQWPEIEFDFDFLMQACQEETWTDVLFKLRQNYSRIELSRYDQHLGEAQNELNLIVEEPPFIIPQAKHYEKRGCTLLLKSSINAFRPELLQKIFPGADLQFIHLTRHPAASINGLMDGWLSPAFHTHNLAHLTSLSIKGYDNKDWWKFDLPPGWCDYTEAPLENVCAFQWLESNQAIAKFLKNKNSCRITYEELTDVEAMKTSLARLALELSLSEDFAFDSKRPETIMSVVPPQKDRWKTRSDILMPLIQSTEIKNLAHSLGYEL